MAGIQGKMRTLNRLRNNSVFVNGLSWITGKSELKQYFENFGKVTNTFIFMDNYRGISKGHAIVQFADQEGMEAAIEQRQHVIDSNEIAVKKNISEQM